MIETSLISVWEASSVVAGMAVRFHDQIYTAERIPQPALEKRESHLPKVEAPSKVKKGEPFQVKVKIGPTRIP
jgi:desulfoferrodoxin (superoxide reductase-like protein)